MSEQVSDGMSEVSAHLAGTPMPKHSIGQFSGPLANEMQSATVEPQHTLNAAGTSAQHTGTPTHPQYSGSNALISSPQSLSSTAQALSRSIISPETVHVEDAGQFFNASMSAASSNESLSNMNEMTALSPAKIQKSDEPDNAWPRDRPKSILRVGMQRQSSGTRVSFADQSIDLDTPVGAALGHSRAAGELCQYKYIEARRKGMKEIFNKYLPHIFVTCLVAILGCIIVFALL